MRKFLLWICLTGTLFAQANSKVDTLYWEADRAVANKDYKLAELKCQQALSLAERDYGKADQRLLIGLEKLYSIHVSGNDRAAAERDRRRILDMVTRIYGANNPQTVQEKLRMAEFYAVEQRWKEANALYEQAIPQLLKDQTISPTVPMAAMQEYVRLLKVQKKNDQAAVWEAKIQELEKEPLRR